LWEEVKGIAKGSKCSLQDVFMLQLGDEYFTYFLSYNTDLDVARCSSAGIELTQNNPAIIGQNLDWDITGENAYLALKIGDSTDGICSIVLSQPGIIGLLGVNNKSVGICMNAIWSQTNNSLTGLPVNFLLRGVLDCQNYEDAVKFIKTVKHSTGENYIIGDKDQVGCFECSPNKVAEYSPLNNPKRVFHTNHVRVNDDLPFPPRNSPVPTPACERFKYLEYTFNDPDFIPDLTGFKEILRSHIGDICRHHNYTINSGCTWASAIFELSEAPKALFTSGRPCEQKYQEFSF